MEKIVDLIDKIKTKMPDNDYLEIMNTLQEIYDTELLREDEFEDYMRIIQEEEGSPNYLPDALVDRLDIYKHKELPLALVRELNKQAKYIKSLHATIISQSLEIHKNNL